MPVSEVSLELVQKQDEDLKQEISRSKTRTLIILLSSSFLLFYWFDSIGTLSLRINEGGFFGGLNPFRFRSFLLIPTIANAVGWLWWGLLTYLGQYKSIVLDSRKSASLPFDETGYRELLDQYQLTKLTYRRQQFLENPITFVVAIQIAFMCLSTVFTLR